MLFGLVFVRTHHISKSIKRVNYPKVWVLIDKERRSLESGRLGPIQGNVDGWKRNENVEQGRPIIGRNCTTGNGRNHDAQHRSGLSIKPAIRSTSLSNEGPSIRTVHLFDQSRTSRAPCHQVDPMCPCQIHRNLNHSPSSRSRPSGCAADSRDIMMVDNVVGVGVRTARRRLCGPK